MAAQSNELFTPAETYHSFKNKCIICGFVFVHTFTDSNGKEITKKYFDNKLKLTEKRKNTIINALGIFIESESDSGICTKCFRSVGRIEDMYQKAYKLKCTLRQSADGLKNTSSSERPPSMASWEKTKCTVNLLHFCRIRCEEFFVGSLKLNNHHKCLFFPSL